MDLYMLWEDVEKSASLLCRRQSSHSAPMGIATGLWPTIHVSRFSFSVLYGLPLHCLQQLSESFLQVLLSSVKAATKAHLVHLFASMCTSYGQIDIELIHGRIINTDCRVCQPRRPSSAVYRTIQYRST